MDKNGESNLNGPTLEIRIPAEHVTATNRQVRTYSFIWHCVSFLFRVYTSSIKSSQGAPV